MKTKFQVTMLNPHQSRIAPVAMPIQGNTRKALDKRAAEFERVGCVILWDTLKTVQVEG